VAKFPTFTLASADLEVLTAWCQKNHMDPESECARVVTAMPLNDGSWFHDPCRPGHRARQRNAPRSLARCGFSPSDAIVVEVEKKLDELKAEGISSAPAPPLPSNPAQPVRSGADPRNKCRVSNWLEPSRL
jgi:hypothetical protein